MNISWLKTSNILVFQIQLIVEVPVFKNKLSRIYKAITFDNCLVILKGHLCASFMCVNVDLCFWVLTKFGNFPEQKTSSTNLEPEL